MQTMRLFAYQCHMAALLESLLQACGHAPGNAHQHPLLVEWLVQLFVVDTCYVPRTAKRLLALSDLPAALERVATQAQRRLQAWCAWTDGPRTRFVVAEMATVPDRHSPGRALRMFFYDEDGRFVSCGTWALHSERRWILSDR